VWWIWFVLLRTVVSMGVTWTEWWMQEISWLVELPKTACCSGWCNRSKSFYFGCVQICKCLWLLCGELGRHISMENEHSETIIWHFITVFGFYMTFVSPSCNEHWDSLYFEATLCTKNTTHCFHICIRVIVLWMYTNAIKPQLKNTLIEQCTSTCFIVQRIYSQLLTLYVSAYS